MHGKKLNCVFFKIHFKLVKCSYWPLKLHVPYVHKNRQEPDNVHLQISELRASARAH